MEKSVIVSVVSIVLTIGIVIGGLIIVGNEQARKNQELRIKERMVCIDAGRTYYIQYSQVICN